ncbi:MAG: type II secretion system secretin GspD [Permianibacter sp.]
MNPISFLTALTDSSLQPRRFRRSVIASALLVGSLGVASFAPTVDAGQAILNLKDADIRVVIEQVSKLTGKTFVLDPRVQGQKITILSQHMMDEKEIYDTFLTILKVYGFAAVETNGIVKIVQEQTARQDSVPVAGPESSKRYRGDEMITRVIKVEHVDANQLVPVLRVLVPQQGHMAPYTRTNVLVINDSAANIERLVEIIRQIDKASEEEVEIIPLKHASADEIVRILENLDRQGAKAEDPINKPRFTADVRTNSILLSAAGKARLRLRAMIAQLDQPVASGGNTKVIYLHYAKAEDVAKVLTGVSQQLEKQEEGKKSEGGSPRGRNGENFSIDSHEDTNALVITAPPDMMRSLEAVIRQLDIRRAQVHVEAMIVEISDNKAKELGVQWLFADRSDDATRPLGVINYTNTGPGIGQIAGAALQQRGQDGTTTVTIDPTTGVRTETTTPSNGDNGAALGQVLGSLQGIGMGLGRIKDNGFSFGAFIRALGSNTDSNVLSMPSVTTLDNEEAEFLAGQEVPVITGSTLGGNNQNPFQQVDRKEIGIKLKLKPQINEGDAVKLTIEQEVSNIAGTTGVDIITNKRSIKNSVLVEDGDTIVLGGLVDDDVQESVQKVPILGDIPLLGHLFKSQKSTKVKRNLLVFIRPTIIRDADSMSQLSARKYDSIRKVQLDAQEDGINLMPGEDTALMPEWENRPKPVLRPEDMKQDGSAPGQAVPATEQEPATPAAVSSETPAATGTEVVEPETTVTEGEER